MDIKERVAQETGTLLFSIKPDLEYIEVISSKFADLIIPLVRAECQREIADETRQAYHYAELIREHFEGHQWSRQQTRYDTAFIADFTHRLMNICNKVYSLTQAKSGTFKEGE